jgi:CBS domain-containing protein
MITINRLLKEKGHRVWKVSKDDTVSDAIKLMADKNIGSVLVMEGKNLVGIFTERDFARKIGADTSEARCKQVKMEEVMTKNVITISGSENVNTCMAIMTDKHIRHLPVIENGEVTGIVSIGDVVKDIIAELQFIVEQMNNYIAGSR